MWGQRFPVRGLDVEFAPPISVDYLVEQGGEITEFHTILVPSDFHSYNDFLRPSQSGILDDSFLVRRFNPDRIAGSWRLFISTSKAPGIYLFDLVFPIFAPNGSTLAFEDVVPIRLEVVPKGTLP